MTQIPAGTKFVGIGATVPTPENRSSQNNAFQEVYTLEDLQYSIPAYKEYVALITQTGTDAPVATEVINTIGSITWSRQDVGYYKATSSTLFTSGKTFINDNGEWNGSSQFMKPLSNGTNSALEGYMESIVESSSVCSIYFRTPTAGGAEMVDLVGTTALMIRIVVYN